MRELRSQHAAELERERLRLAEEGERAKKAALEDATAQCESERDLLTQSHEEAMAAHANGL